jgi:hypothetical protein
MGNKPIKREIHDVLERFGHFLDLQPSSGEYNIVICGGAALNLVGLIKRDTGDIDILAIPESENSDQELDYPKMDQSFHKAAKDFRRNEGLPENWINTGPQGLAKHPPDGLLDRAETFSFGESLTVHAINRYDQIHFKLHAARDTTEPHRSDLEDLEPTDDELIKAARWSLFDVASQMSFSKQWKGLKEILDYLDRQKVIEEVEQDIELEEEQENERNFKFNP